MSNRRLWSQLPDDIFSDGICLDSEGAVWVASTTNKVVRTKEGGEITDEIALDSLCYAVMLGGPNRQHLFLCCSDSHNPEEIAASPSARIYTMPVDVPGAGTP